MTNLTHSSTNITTNQHNHHQPSILTQNEIIKIIDSCDNKEHAGMFSKDTKILAFILFKVASLKDCGAMTKTFEDFFVSSSPALRLISAVSHNINMATSINTAYRSDFDIKGNTAIIIQLVSITP